jgi:hypothetical protein
MWFLKGLFHVISVIFVSLLKFIALWIAYGFSWFMFLCVLIFVFRRAPERATTKKRGKVSIDFWVCLWFGFMTAVIHSIIWLLI